MFSEYDRWDDCADLVYDPYTGRYVEPWNACACADGGEALVGDAVLGILAAMEFLWGIVVGLILLVAHIVLKIIEWDDIRQEYKRLHEEKEPLGYQYDAHLKEWGTGVREKLVLTEWGLLPEEEICRRMEFRSSRSRSAGTGERGRWRLEGSGMVKDET
ncbi:hypothetical protein [Desulfofundulus thermobenzoicus]|nr:hypothetical protein [Desulfofundulus thermobenzoicus]